MIQKIIDGISEAIYKAFGEDYEIYTESVEQGLKEPCFSILCISPTKEQFLGKRYFRGNHFCIYYFPKSEEPIGQCHEVRELLFDCLENIVVDGDLTRGAHFTSEIENGVLLVLVQYDVFTREIMEEIPMDDLIDQTTVKG